MELRQRKRSPASRNRSSITCDAEPNKGKGAKTLKEGGGGGRWTKDRRWLKVAGGGGRAAVMGLFAGGGDYKKHQEIHTLEPSSFFFF